MFTTTQVCSSNAHMKLLSGADRQQAITWANADPDLCRPLVSLVDNPENVTVALTVIGNKPLALLAITTLWPRQDGLHFGDYIFKLIFLVSKWLYFNSQFTEIHSKCTGDPLHSRALAHSRAPLSTQPCPHCSHSRAPGEQWARLCVFTLHGCVQAARLCRGSPVKWSN